MLLHVGDRYEYSYLIDKHPIKPYQLYIYYACVYDIIIMT
jgi:hypothetical protein